MTVDLVVLSSSPMKGDKPFGAQTNYFRDLSACACERGLTLAVADASEAKRERGKWKFPLFDVDGRSRGHGSGWVYYDRVSDVHRWQTDEKSRLVLEDEAPVFNSWNSLSFSQDKYSVYEKLSRHSEICVPTTVAISGLVDGPELVDRLADTVILKPRIGTKGRGVQSVRRCGASFLIGEERFTVDGMVQRYPQYILQDDIFATHGGLAEMRTLVQAVAGPPQAVGSFVKVLTAPGPGNLSQTCRATALDETEIGMEHRRESVERAALTALSVLSASVGPGLFETGVDQIVSEDGRVWLLEINGRPARFGFQLIARYSKKKVNRDQYAMIRHAAVDNVVAHAQELSRSAL